MDLKSQWKASKKELFMLLGNLSRFSLPLWVNIVILFSFQAVVTTEDPQSKRFDKSRRLFENADDNRQENEIARKQREAKEKDMQVIKQSY